VGKQVGITLFGWLAVCAADAAPPAGVTRRHLYGSGWLGGIRFTMSVIVAAKLGALAASAIAGAVSYLLIRSARRP
jgi:NhaA family Na+:H+ antiporter